MKNYSINIVVIKARERSQHKLQSSQLQLNTNDFTARNYLKLNFEEI